MKKFFAPFLFFASLAGPMFGADEAITVKRVDFNSLQDNWVQMEVELACNGNPSPDARDKRYVEKIKVKVYLAYVRDASAREYDYYSSEVEIVIMEQGDDNNVYFYLPGLIVERDRLPTDPEFYYAEVLVDGEAQEPQKSAMSSNIPNLDILKSFVSKVEGDGQTNEHLLMPIYFAPSDRLGRISKLPTFLRRDVRD